MALNLRIYHRQGEKDQDVIRETVRMMEVWFTFSSSNQTDVDACFYINARGSTGKINYMITEEDGGKSSCLPELLKRKLNNKEPDRYL
ncbi:MAG: hypothetical protein OEX02_10770 [Cyclobacteriaceae bacterium]|nr:hypothetical protein [Cyclobacteriaceae bacterium]